jgi:DNA topoisomerase-3
METGFIGPLSGFISKSKKPFNAGLKFVDGKVELEFENKEKEEDPQYFQNLKVLGKLKDDSTVYEDQLAYVTDNPNSTFRLPKTLLGRTIPPEQMVKILNEGRSDLLEGFRSKRTKRLFAAYLSLDKKGNIVFEFADRNVSSKS